MGAQRSPPFLGQHIHLPDSSRLPGVEAHLFTSHSICSLSSRLRGLHGDAGKRPKHLGEVCGLMPTAEWQKVSAECSQAKLQVLGAQQGAPDWSLSTWPVAQATHAKCRSGWSLPLVREGRAVGGGGSGRCVWSDL